MRRVWGIAAVLIAAGTVGVTSNGRDRPPSPVLAASSADGGGDSSLAVGAQFISALVGHNFDGAEALLASDVEFKGYTPTKGFFELRGPAEVMTLMREWYAPTDQTIDALETGRMLDRWHVGYRIRWSTPDLGAFVFEQQAYYDVVDGRIGRWQLVCSGDRPITPA